MFEIIKKSGIKLTPENENKLNKFKELLILYNEKFNLTSIKNDEEIEVKHFLDSLIGEKFFIKNKKVVEIGSGGGFPSIPLMIYRDDLNFTLVESTGKKCEFLKTVVDSLNLKGKILNKRAEDLGKDSNYRESFDIVTARAVARLNTLLEYCLPLIKVGGIFIAYKGDSEEEIKESKNALEILGGKIIKVEEFKLVNENKRTIIVIEKVKETPIKYPRGNGKERSKPL